MVDVLLTTAGNPVGHQVLRSLTSHGLKVAVSDSSQEALARYCKGAAASVVLPDAQKHTSAFADELCAAAADLNAAVIFPIFHPEAVSRATQMLPQGTLVPIDSLEKLQILDNKCTCSRLATDLGIPQPRIYSDPDEIGEYPVVFKRPGGLGGSAVYFPGSRASLDKLVATQKQHLIMEFVPGYDVCVDAVRWDCYFRAGAYKVILPRRKGFSVLRESVLMPEITEYARTLLEAIDFRGACGMDFRVDERSGKALFLECNPRFSGGISTQIAAGFDLPWELWQLCHGTSPGLCEVPVRAGVRTMSLEGARRLLRSRNVPLRDKLKCIIPGTLRFDER